METGVNSNKLAILIDADNAQPSIIELLLDEVAKYGTANVKRIYGDWTKPHLRSWKEQLLEFSLQPIQQFAYTKGKNSTDSALIIDAMDLLYSEKFDGFCLVSSDSDFTKLAVRLRREGMMVFGFGETKTPNSFVQACNKFIYTEVLGENIKTSQALNSSISKKTTNELKGDTKLIDTLRNAVDKASNEDNWAYLADVGNYIAKQSTDFDPRNYGYKKLGHLIEATDLFEVERRPTGNGEVEVLHVKDKRI
jgi:uncharacterized LabA/DUF88 family protein